MRSRPARLMAVVGALGLLAAASAAALPQTSAPRPFRNGTYEASGVVEVPGAGGVLFVDDGRPKHVFWMGVSADGDTSAVVPVPIGAQVPDMEDIAFDGRYYYVVGSQSQGGGRQADGLVRFTFDASTRAVDQVERVTGLRQLLAAALPGLTGGRRQDGLNIEGLTWDAAGARLLLGLRGPMAGSDAVIVPIAIRDRMAPLSGEALTVGTPIELPLQGRAIRGLGYDADRRIVLVLGGASTNGPGVPFVLYEWDPRAPAGPRPVATFPREQKPEGVTRLHVGGRVRTLVVFDSSGVALLDQGAGAPAGRTGYNPSQTR